MGKGAHLCPPSYRPCPHHDGINPESILKKGIRSLTFSMVAKLTMSLYLRTVAFQCLHVGVALGVEGGGLLSQANLALHTPWFQPFCVGRAAFPSSGVNASQSR